MILVEVFVAELGVVIVEDMNMELKVILIMEISEVSVNISKVELV